jgi:Flp pilus assembly protein TadD
VAIIALGAFALGGTNYLRTRVWRNDVALGADMVRTSPRSAFAHDFLGQGLLADGRYREAFEVFLEAVSLDPINPDTHNDLGISLRRLNQPVLAAKEFRRSIRLAPNAVGARLNLAYACITLGDIPCVEEQRKALAALNPEALAELERVIRQQKR